MAQSQSNQVENIQRVRTLDGQLSKIAVDTRGQVKVEISLPLHIAVQHAAPLLEAYGASVSVMLD